jgi:ribosomal protein L33
MKKTTDWREDYAALIAELTDSLAGEPTIVSISGKLLLLRLSTELKAIFVKCQQEATLEAVNVSSNYVKKLRAEEQEKLEAAGYCPTCKRPFEQKQ